MCVYTHTHTHTHPYIYSHTHILSFIHPRIFLVYPFWGVINYVGPSQVALVVKNPPATTVDTRDLSLIPGLGRFPGVGHDISLLYSCLENSMDRGAWQATFHRVTKSQTRLSTSIILILINLGLSKYFIVHLLSILLIRLFVFIISRLQRFLSLTCYPFYSFLRWKLDFFQLFLFSNIHILFYKFSSSIVLVAF